jgi:hydroxyethylthiazole kinase-like sugar kinase family protein
VVDRLIGPSGEIACWSGSRIHTRHTHGTGCTLSSAIATRLGAGSSLTDAVTLAREYVRAAMLAAPGLGEGHGPMGHALGTYHFRHSREGGNPYSQEQEVMDSRLRGNDGRGLQ